MRRAGRFGRPSMLAVTEGCPADEVLRPARRTRSPARHRVRGRVRRRRAVGTSGAPQAPCGLHLGGRSQRGRR
jgi:hypothetical protein